MRKIFSHSLIFIITLLSLYLLLVAASAIPNDMIKANMEKSALSYKEKQAFSYDGETKLKDTADNYADAILLCVSWNMGDGSPFVSALDTKYNDGGDYGENAGFYLSVTQNEKPNTDYSRYWHGSAMLIRPLHLFSDVDGIKLMGLIFAILLAVIALIILIKHKHIMLGVSLALSLALVHIWNIRLSLEYQPAILIALLFCILFLIAERKSDNALTHLSVICGVAVAFFDFLTTETLTILLPLILTIAVRAKEQRCGDFKSCIRLLLFCLISWGIAYCLTFILKWSVASLATGENKFILALTSAEERFGSTAETNLNPIAAIFLAPLANLSTLFGSVVRVDIPRVVIGILLFAMIVISVVYLFGKKSTDKTPQKLLSILGMIVFVRFMILSNHSYLHEFFTYRALAAPILAVLAGLCISCTPSRKEAKKR